MEGFMFINIYRKVKATVTNNKDDIRFYLKMGCTYLPLFVLSILTNFACYDLLLNTNNSGDVIKMVGASSMLLTIFLSYRIAVLDERYISNKLKTRHNMQEIV